MSRSALALSVRVERWPIAGSFVISRGAKSEAVVVVAELSRGDHRGRGECVPYARYGETVADVAEAIRAMATELARGLDRTGLQSAMPPGAARNALDCAFWDLEAKCAGGPVRNGRGGRTAWPHADGGMHGGDIARHGPCPALGAARGRGGSRWAASARARSAGWASL